MHISVSPQAATPEQHITSELGGTTNWWSYTISKRQCHHTRNAGASVISSTHATTNTGIEVIVQHVCNDHCMTW